MLELDDSPVPALPAIQDNAHKGTRGVVAVVGGCAAGDPMIGAPALAARAAFRSGAGLVRLVMPGPVLVAGLTMCPSATGIGLATDDDGGLIRHEAAEAIDRALDGCDAASVGPGLGASERVSGVADAVLRVIQRDDVPVVLDADALNALAGTPGFGEDLRAPAILTPHPGEFARLAQALRINDDPVDPDARPGAAGALARRLGVIVVLKGANTVVSDGHRAWVCPARQPALATAGTGDVLCGLLGALVAAHWTAPFPGIPSSVPSLYDLARLGVEAHARAADLWCTSRGASSGMLASELADHLPMALHPRDRR